jgi:hypothetical protein
VSYFSRCGRLYPLGGQLYLVYGLAIGYSHMARLRLDLSPAFRDT